MIREKEAFLQNIFKFLDAIAISCAFVLSYFIGFYLRGILSLGEMAYAESMDFVGFLGFFKSNYILLVAYIPGWIVALTTQGAYYEFRTKPFVRTIFEVSKSSAITTLILGSLIFLVQLKMTSRLFIGIYCASSVLLILTERYLMTILLDYFHTRGFNQVNLLIVGTGKRSIQFIRTVKEHSNWGLSIVGLIDDDHGKFGKVIEGYRVLGRIQDIPFILHRKVIDRVIFVVPRLWLNRIDEAILACEREGIATSISMDLYNLNIAKVRQTDFSGLPLLEFETFSASQLQLFVKRTLDIIFSLSLLILLAPLMLTVAIAIKIESRGPIFFKQLRSGLNGRLFTLYKFRSMVVNAEVKKKNLMKQNEMDGPTFKMKRDPRITRLGRIIRKMSIDELPQLLNVLLGDMSIVGPRPPLPVEVELYQIWQRRRLSLKPGITCIWQVSGRNNIRFDRWMEMDLEYIDNWSLWLDFKIMFKTFFVVITGYGAS